VTTLQHEREVVQQLRREANIKRINVSQAAEDIKVQGVSTIMAFLYFYSEKEQIKCFLQRHNFFLIL